MTILQTGEKVMDNIVNSQITYLEIFKNSLILYFKNLKLFVKYLAFPVAGITLGFSIAVIPAIIFSPIAITGSFLHYLLISLAGLLVGLVIFVKAFWRYIIAAASTVYMSQDLIKSGFIKSVDMYDREIRSRAKEYIIYLLIISIVSVVFSLGIITLPLVFFFLLYLQVYVLEKNETPAKAFLRNFSLVKGHFWATLWLGILIILATAVLTLPALLFAFNKHLYGAASTVISLMLLPLINLILTYWYYKIVQS